MSVVSFMSLSSVSPLSSPRSQPSSHSDGPQPPDQHHQESTGTFCQSSQKHWARLARVTLDVCAAEEAAWEECLSETLENEVQEARKMVSALQVGPSSGGFSSAVKLCSPLDLQAKGWI